MKVISIGTDKKVFEKNSPVYVRMEEYKKLFDRFEIVLFSKISDYFKLNQIGKIVDRTTVVTTQDPFETGLFGLLLKIFYNANLQIQLHTDFRNRHFLFSSPLNFIRFFLGHLTLPFADGVRVVSNRVKGSLSSINKKITVLPIVVEKKVYNQGVKKRKSILIVSRLEKEKDIETGIKVFKIVSAKFPEATLTIVGDGRERKKLENISKIYNLTTKIFFVGWQYDVDKYYQESEVYLSTSLFEGFGMSVVEAALAGCALVISNTGVAGEIPALVSKQKDINKFAENIIKLISDSSFLREMSEKSKKGAEMLVIPKEEYLKRYKMAIESVVKK
jgi:glycosyltransferase involved in cell wall biosynthesis